MCILFTAHFNCWPIPVAAASKAWACNRPLAGNAGSNPLGGVDVSLSLVSVVCCQVESLQRADHSSRGVIPSVVCLNVISKP
jgi:hypothetical protein